MIEGIRALPWIEEARSKDGQSDFLTCETCMQSNGYQMRRVMKCGFIPVDEHVPGMHWQPDAFDLTVCAGYSTALPEVLDAVKNYDNYESGNLHYSCGGDPPPVLLDAISLLRGSVRSKDAYRMREQAKKNGGGHGHR